MGFLLCGAHLITYPSPDLFIGLHISFLQKGNREEYFPLRGILGYVIRPQYIKYVAPCIKGSIC